MNYQQTLDYLLQKLPMYQRKGSIAYKKDLSNTLDFCSKAGNPQDKLKVIHVAGTNGKGSVSHIIASVLQEQGYKTGLYTSPHLIDFRERIRINGKMIPEQEVVDFTREFQSSIENIQPSFFEVTAVMAFWYFNNQNTDIAVIETGLGGRLDSTNVVDPLLSVITNISLEHQQFLGDTIDAIAGEKAGIIKPEKPVVIGKKEPVSGSVFLKIANERKAPLYFAEDSVQVSKKVKDGGKNTELTITNNGKPFGRKVFPDVSGDYQQENTTTVVAALDVLSKFYPAFETDEENTAKGIENVIENTGLAGRWQVLQQTPTVIADIAHNYEGLSRVFSQVNAMQYDKLHLVYGTVTEKQPETLTGLFPSEADFYLCTPEIERGMPVAELIPKLNIDQKRIKINENPGKAYTDAFNNAGKNDLILITGSAFVVADVMKSIKKPVEKEPQKV